MRVTRAAGALFRVSIALVVVSLLTPVAAAGVVLATYLFVPLPATLPKAEPIEAIQFSHVFDADGNEIHVYRQFDSNVPVSPEDIPQVLKDAIISSEDRNFYAHQGVDVRGTLRALWADYRNRGAVQGGSTITQQLARNAYGSGRERTLERKIKEAVLASQIDRSLPKDQILFQYLSVVYFGEGAYGVGAAAQTYFGKRVNDLDLGEAALLAGIIPAPSVYNPRADPELAKERRDLVLDQMQLTGKATPEEVAQRKGLAVWLEAGGPPPAPALVIKSAQTAPTVHPYFIQYLTQHLSERLGGEDVLYRGGLTIETTLDPRAQFVASDSVGRTLAGIDPRTSTRDGRTVTHTMQMSLVAVEPKTGFVRALVGGRDFGTDQTNNAIKGAGSIGRQAGSAFKPFVLAQALEQGIPPDKAYSGGPHTVGEKTFANYGGSSYGRMSLRSATHKSVNTVYTRLIEDVGPPAVVDLSNKLGLQIPPLDPARDGSGIQLALGSREVSPLGMASAYATFANQGEYVAPTPVVRVTAPDGKVLIDDSQPEGTQVMKPAVADTVTQILRGVLTSGTAAGKGIGRPAAGKTGTASDNKDAWFVGYTPTLSTAVWMGFDIPFEMRSIKGRTVTGGSYPAETWQRFMKGALADVPVTDFSEPAPLREVATDAKKKARQGFAPGPRQQASGTERGSYVFDIAPAEAPPPTTTTTSTTAPPEATTTTTEPEDEGGLFGT